MAKSKKGNKASKVVARAPRNRAIQTQSARKSEKTPDANTPVDAQPAQSERARLRPIDQA